MGFIAAPSTSSGSAAKKKRADGDADAEELEKIRRWKEELKRGMAPKESKSKAPKKSKKDAVPACASAPAEE